MMQQIVIPKAVRRYPRLDTVLLVERFVQRHDGEFTRKQLWEKLPVGMMYQTFRVIVQYLLYSQKISIDAEGKVGWIYYPSRSTPSTLFWRTDAPPV